MNNEDILETCKKQLKIHIDKLVDQGVKKANIEIELIHYLKSLLYSDGH